MVEIPDMVPGLHEEAKNGYRNASIDLINRLIATLKKGKDLSDTEKKYLLECLQRTISFQDANKGFYLSYPRGEQKKDTTLRDYSAAQIMVRSEGAELSYDERLTQTAKEINLYFPEAPADKKSVEKAYTKYKEVVLINDEIDRETLPYFKHHLD